MPHMTENQRLLLTAYLDAGLSISIIGRFLAIPTEKIRREIKRYLQTLKSSRSQFLLSNPAADCERLKKTPHVCNGCPLNCHCLRPRIFYNGYHAHQIYKKNLTVCRKSSYRNAELLTELSRILGNGLRNGESVHHIIINHSQILNCSEKTIYNYINRNLLPGIRPKCTGPQNQHS